LVFAARGEALPHPEVDLSVAEKLRSEDTARSSAASVHPTAIDNILRLALNGVAARAPAAAPKAPEPNFEKAADLLDKATSAIASLTARRDELEQVLLQQEKAFNERLRALQDDVAEWERRAKVTKAQLQDSENRASEQQLRIETLTYRAEQAEARAILAEQAASDARKQAQLYHDKILTALGGLS
jgi:hypothetical protein